MKSQILQQTISQMRSQRMLTTVSIAGTALSIFLIMVVVMLQQVRVAPFSPESRRDRFLHSKMASMHAIEHPQYENNGPLSYKSAIEQFGKLTIPEAVAIYECESGPANVYVPGSPSFGSDVRSTDDGFWRVFDFRFIDGKPYDKATFDAGLPVAVIDESTARRLFGTSDAAGRDFMLNHAQFNVCGVVKDVSTLANSCFSHIWVPASVTNVINNTWMHELMGSFSVTILAKSSDDFDDIRAEYERMINEQNKSIKDIGWKFFTRNRPYTQEQDSISPWANIEPDLEGARRTRLIIYLILLIIPAINLSGMTESRLRKRVEEIGVRRAFGCKRSTLLAQLFGENLLITLAAGIIGWLFSVAFAIMFSSALFTPGFSYTTTVPTVDLGMLIQPSTFLQALLFCFVLNLLSSSVPAWRASRTNIVNAINKH